jgi:hypothetical protein
MDIRLKTATNACHAAKDRRYHRVTGAADALLLPPPPLLLLLLQ